MVVKIEQTVWAFSCPSLSRLLLTILKVADCELGFLFKEKRTNLTVGAKAIKMLRAPGSQIEKFSVLLAVLALQCPCQTISAP
jgi:hypothetical protein